MLQDILELSKEQDKICNIGLSIFDKFARECFGDRYYCAVPNNIFLQSFKEDIHIPKSNIVFFDLTNPNEVPEQTFDIVIFAETLEHILADDDVIIKSVSRLVARGGRLYFTVPNACRHINRLKLLLGKNIHWTKRDIINGVFNGYGHLREYTFSEVSDLLENEFVIEKLYGLNPYGKPWQIALLNTFPNRWKSVIVAVARKI
ncbi:MAG: class I SAM-dependent methyltransferase [Candidatus Thermoplasmatota archaeon]|nr:class I SAM-dependent methyltransferase [Candidatus Thermoplasmatota archaeon]